MTLWMRHEYSNQFFRCSSSAVILCSFPFFLQKIGSQRTIFDRQRQLIPEIDNGFSIQDTTLHSLPLRHQWHLLPGCFSKDPLNLSHQFLLLPSCIDGQCSSEALVQVEEYRMTFGGKSYLAMGSWQKAVNTEIILSKLYFTNPNSSDAHGRAIYENPPSDGWCHSSSPSIGVMWCSKKARHQNKIQCRVLQGNTLIAWACSCWREKTHILDFDFNVILEVLPSTSHTSNNDNSAIEKVLHAMMESHLCYMTFCGGVNWSHSDSDSHSTLHHS